MDSEISKIYSIPFGELQYCIDNGIMYQRNMSVSVPYDENYYSKYVKYEGTKIAQGINDVRTSLTQKYCCCLLDIGVGSGEFIKKSQEAGVKMFGYDINPVAVEMLQTDSIYVDPYNGINQPIQGICLWDTMEHIPEPTRLLNEVKPGMYVFVSMPIFSDLTKVRKSKHYRPNEHYYYFTATGLTGYMKRLNLDLVEMSDGEGLAGREDITTFVFVRKS